MCFFVLYEHLEWLCKERGISVSKLLGEIGVSKSAASANTNIQRLTSSSKVVVGLSLFSALLFLLK